VAGFDAVVKSVDGRREKRDGEKRLTGGGGKEKRVPRTGRALRIVNEQKKAAISRRGKKEAGQHQFHSLCLLAERYIFLPSAGQRGD